MSDADTRTLEKRVADLEEKVADPVVRFTRLNEEAIQPQYQTAGAAGLDLHSALYWEMEVWPGQTVLIPTGIAIALPHGFEAQVRSRSSYARAGLVVSNSPGTIDEDYRGEVKVLMHNHGNHKQVIKSGDRIAQMVVARVARATFEEVKELGETERGAGGFGSTGK